ncbi:related to NIT3 Nitrilase [Cephalotrichum gorgonifer]|uniref:Related to NIT3 Nitrilase n=1 Tax=Cephalotrichum gorgonifer TaxID=2041049 RepID=A0AAE8MY85_9PEZI|nr:related to NIT3 Nitrilase [Cephalotrichum gorgonifer]
MATNIKIALIQLHPKPLSPTYNLSKATRHIEAAASRGAHLAILPEYAVTSWQPSSPNFLSSCESASSALSVFKHLAETHHIAIVPGTIVEKLPNGALANVCYFISSKGEVVSRYVKRNLWHPERGVLSPDQRPHEPFDTEFGKVGLLVCWDLAFPEAARELVSKGAKLIVAPAWWLMNDAGDQGAALNPQSETVFLESLIVCRAFENTCAIAFVNAANPATEGERGADIEANGGMVRGFAGLSQVGMPILGALGRMGAAEGMEIVEVDMGVLDVAEENYRVREDLAREDWHYLVSSKASEAE